jgi:hypothetical protein
VVAESGASPVSTPRAPWHTHSWLWSASFDHTNLAPAAQAQMHRRRANSENSPFFRLPPEVNTRRLKPQLYVCTEVGQNQYPLAEIQYDGSHRDLDPVITKLFLDKCGTPSSLPFRQSTGRLHGVKAVWNFASRALFHGSGSWWEILSERYMNGADSVRCRIAGNDENFGRFRIHRQVF